MINIFSEDIKEYGEEILELRRRIHRNPEMGNHEFKTSELIESCLKEWGIEAKRPLDTGVIGILRGGKPGPAVALRGDMDALPVTEQTGVEWASKVPGVMHACGHDVHTAGLLGAARILSLHRDQLEGTVVFIFQPDEEGNGGAERLIESGCLEGVQAVFGAHVSPEFEAGHIGIRYGKFYGASDMFTVTVKGRGAHGAEPEKGIDAIAAACHMISELHRLPGKVTQDKCVLTVGKIDGGTAGNIVADNVEFQGIIRTLGPETRAKMKEQFFAAVQTVSEEHGTQAEISYRSSYPGVVNDDSMTELAEKTAVSLFGADRVHIISEPTMMTEDFGYYAMEVPGCFYQIGAGCALPLHNPGFIPQEQVTIELASMNIALVMNYFQHKKH